MSIHIEVTNDQTNAKEDVKGSDGRMNTSARSASRANYNSRDRGQCYSFRFSHPGAVAGEVSALVQNLRDDGKHLVIVSAGVNSVQTSRIQLIKATVTTAAGGAVVTPFNLNVPSANKAKALAMTGLSGNEITGVTEGAIIDDVGVVAGGHEEFRFQDMLRLGQDDAVIIKYLTGTTGDAWGIFFGYFE